MTDPNSSFQVRKPNDRSLLEMFDALEREHSFSKPTINIIGLNRGLEEANVAAVFVQLRRDRAYSIVHGTSNVNGITVTFERGVYVLSQNGQNYQRIDSPLFDTVRVQTNSQLALNPTDVASVIRSIQDNLNGIGESAAAVGDSVLQATINSHREIVSKFEQALSDVGLQFAAKRLELEREFDERRHKLQHDFDAAQAKSEEAVAAERLKILDESQRLEERSKALDDRENTHVRRDLRQQLKGQFTDYRKAFELTKGTRGLRTPIHVAAGLLISTLIISIIYMFTREAPNDPWLYAAFLIKPIGLTFLTVALATWYINWMNRWFDRHADAEFRLKELELDIDRASWVVETAFEWKETRESVFPEKLLDAISRNLFTAKDGAEKPELNPADHLASALLGEAARAKLSVGGNEIEFERNALKKARKEA